MMTLGHASPGIGLVKVKRGASPALVAAGTFPALLQACPALNMGLRDVLARTPTPYKVLARSSADCKAGVQGLWQAEHLYLVESQALGLKMLVVQWIIDR